MPDSAKSQRSTADYVPFRTASYSDRADKYARGRPGYPVTVAELLVEVSGIKSNGRIADVGAGTGIFSELLLANGYQVDAIEPDAKMRRLAIERCSGSSNFQAHAGKAENIPLPSKSVNAVTVAQALHWFTSETAAAEFRRITSKQALLFCVWNERRREGTQFLNDLECTLQKELPAYKGTIAPELNPVDLTRPYSADANIHIRKFFSVQSLDWSGFLARMLSSSFAPAAGSAKELAFCEILESLFLLHACDGLVEIEYDTIVTYCRLHQD